MTNVIYPAWPSAAPLTAQAARLTLDPAVAIASVGIAEGAAATLTNVAREWARSPVCYREASELFSLICRVETLAAQVAAPFELSEQA